MLVYVNTETLERCNDLLLVQSLRLLQRIMVTVSLAASSLTF